MTEMPKLLKQERQVALDVLKFETSQKLFSSENKWIFNGKTETINSTKDLYIKVSDICDFIYSKTPKYDNELINRNILVSILTARRALLNQILDHGSDRNLNYLDNKFPPDKAIYISLIRETDFMQLIRNKIFIDFMSQKKTLFYLNYGQIVMIF